MSVKELKALIGRAGLSCVDCVEKSDLRARARQAVARLDEAKRIQDKTPQPSPAKPARSPPVPPSPKASRPGVPVPGAPRPGTYVYRAGAPPPKPPPQWQPPPPQPQPAPQKPSPAKKKWSAADMYDSDGNEKFDVTTSDESDAEAAPAPAPPPKRRRRRDTYDSDDPPSDCVSEEEYKPRGSKRRPRAAKKRR